MQNKALGKKEASADTIKKKIKLKRSYCSNAQKSESLGGRKRQ